MRNKVCVCLVVKMIPFLLSVFLNSCSSKYKSADIRDLGISWHPSPQKLAEIKGTKYDPTRVRAFANYSAIYAIPTVAVYDTCSRKEEQIPFPDTEKWDEILPREVGISAKKGFAARAWIRSKRGQPKEVVIAYRGTSGVGEGIFKDFYYANLVPLTGAIMKNQYDLAYEYALKVKNTLPKKHTNLPIVLTGHSLGGGLAEYVQRMLPGSKSITFDTSPNQGRLYSLFRKKTNKREAVRIYEKGEILSYFRYLLSPDLKLEDTPLGSGVRAARFDFYRGGPFKQHGSHDLCMALIRVSASTGNCEAVSVIKQLELRRDPLSLPPLNKNNIYRRQIRHDILSSYYR